MATKNTVAKALQSSPTTLRLVVFGQGSTENRTATLLRFSEGLREELNEVAQGQFYLLIEYAVRKLIEDLKAMPPGQVLAINAADLQAEPARNKVPRKTRKKTKTE